MTEAAGEMGAGGAGTSRPVSMPLVLGIAFLPGIFTWFLLREGYGTRARALGLGWVALHLLLFLALDPGPWNETRDTEQVALQDAAAPARDTAAALTQSTDKAGKQPALPGNPGCTRTDETPGWEAIEVNAILTADRYAVANNPRAAFADAKARIFWNPDEDHPEDLTKGSYSLILTNDQVALAELLPLFDFCTPATELDPEGELWKVNLAKLNGKVF